MRKPHSYRQLRESLVTKAFACKELRQQAEKLNGKAVVVTGTLQIRKGVEVKERRIITVKSLKPADEK